MSAPKYLTQDQLKAFFQAIKKERRRVLRTRDLALFQLSYLCGLRIGEAAGLRLDDLHLDEGLLMVRRLKRKQFKDGKPLEKKKGPVISPCLLTVEAKRALLDWLKLRGQFKVAQTNPFIFINRLAGESDHLTTTALYLRFKKVAQTAGIAGRSPHSLRHSCAIMMARAGMNAFDIQDRLGHVSSSSTEHYVKFFGKEAEERSRKINKALEIGL